MGFFRPSAEFAGRVEGEQARAEGECVLRAEDKYCNHPSSKSPLALGAHYIFCKTFFIIKQSLCAAGGA